MKLPKTKLKALFSDIIRGFTEAHSEKFGSVFIKHFTNFDSASIDSKNEEYVFRAKSRGLPSREEKEKWLIAEDIWPETKDREIIQLESFVRNLKVTKTKLFKQADLKDIDTQIAESDLKLKLLEFEKEQLIGLTSETYASKKINEHYIHTALFRNSSLTQNLFNTDDFFDLEQSEIASLINIYNEAMSNFNEANLKRIALSSFFTNFFYLSEDNPLVFYGKPVIQLTFYQAELFGYGRYFKSIINNSKSRPSEELLEDPEKLVDWFSSNENAQSLLDKNPDAAGASLVGATKEDYKKLGIETGDTNRLLDEVKKNGGVMGFQDFINLHGVN